MSDLYGAAGTPDGSGDKEESSFNLPVARENAVACNTCIHYNKDGRTCKAFPDLIPFEIRNGSNPHTAPMEGDNGIMYEPLPEKNTQGNELMVEADESRTGY